MRKPSNNINANIETEIASLATIKHGLTKLSSAGTFRSLDQNEIPENKSVVTFILIPERSWNEWEVYSYFCIVQNN